MKEIYVMVGKFYNTEACGASDDFNVMSSLIMKQRNPSMYKLKVYNSETGEYLRTVSGEKIAQSIFNKNILKLPYVSFEKLVEKEIEEEHLEVDNIEIQLKCCEGSTEGDYDIEVYEIRGELKKIKFFFNKKDYMKIIRTPAYMGELIKKGNAYITVEDSGELYHCGRIEIEGI